jgi:hypothetical protein
MGILTNVIRDLGVMSSYLWRINDLKLSFIRALTLNIRFGRSKAWASPELADRFQRNQMVSTTFDESMARLPVAR